MQFNIALSPQDLSLPNPSFCGDLKTIEKCPAQPGCYLIWFYIDQNLDIARPSHSFLPKGWHLYSGSAKGPGGLRARVRHHLKTDKQPRWHIDQISTNATIHMAWAWTEIDWSSGSECRLMQSLNKSPYFNHLIPGFGSSDCKTCKSHLITHQKLLIDN